MSRKLSRFSHFSFIHPKMYCINKSVNTKNIENGFVEKNDKNMCMTNHPLATWQCLLGSLSLTQVKYQKQIQKFTS